MCHSVPLSVTTMISMKMLDMTMLTVLLVNMYILNIARTATVADAFLSVKQMCVDCYDYTDRLSSVHGSMNLVDHTEQ